MGFGEYRSESSSMVTLRRVARVGSEEEFLLSIGLADTTITMLAQRARTNSTPVEVELIASGFISEVDFYQCIAAYLGLSFLAVIEPDHIFPSANLDTRLICPTLARLNPPGQNPITVLVPELSRLALYHRMISDAPGTKNSLRISTPSAIRNAVWAMEEHARLKQTVGELFDHRPEVSARITFHGTQGFLAGACLSGFFALLMFSPENTLFFSHVFLSLFYFSSLILKGMAVRFCRKAPPAPLLGHQSYLPVYTVLVALYRETEIVSQLIQRLEMIDWPRSKLDIKIICEADDLETIAALKAENPGPQIDIVRVPAGGPRTKPNALSYALKAARGDFLAVYDAEDRPHPGQLREAYQQFCELPDNVACLQAPLIIANGGENWLTALFALEYAGLFRGLLPLLAHHGLPMPLGGTSNHFRRAVLDECGAWDPYNVTEDADLGMRLYRAGYRTKTLHRATLEDAPNTVQAWMGQRTRWFKGWLQTWLVVMRHPLKAAHDMGLRGTLFFHLLITAMLISALGHPLMIFFLLNGFADLLAFQGTKIGTMVLSGADCINIVGSYLLFARLGRIVMSNGEKKRVGWNFLLVPIYWVLISIAAWKALLELRTDPFFWNKTAHKPSVF